MNKQGGQVLISNEMAGQMNAQIGHEFGASLQYVNVAGYFDNAGLPVLAQFFLKQADEERMHAMRFVRYIMDAGGHLAVPAIPASRHAFKSAEEAVSMGDRCGARQPLGRSRGRALRPWVPRSHALPRDAPPSSSA